MRIPLKHRPVLSAARAAGLAAGGNLGGLALGVRRRGVRATTQNFSPTILELDAALRSGRLRHDGDPVLEWCVGNVVGRPDRRGNLYPAKQRPEQKIDAAIALMMAVGRAMAEDTNEGDLTDFLRNPLIA